MANQYTVKRDGRRARGSVTVKLSTEERALIEQGAATLQETRSETLRHGGLHRAAAARRAADVLPYRCEFCPAQFSNLTEAMAHVETTHPKDGEQ